MFKAKTIIEEIKRFSPETFETCNEAIEKSELDLDFQRLDKDSFSKCPNASIDKVIMEKTKRGTVLPLDVGWSDIGSWEAVWETSEKDDEENFTRGKVIIEDTNSCYLRSENNY